MVIYSDISPSYSLLFSLLALKGLLGEENADLVPECSRVSYLKKSFTSPCLVREIIESIFVYYKRGRLLN